VPLVYHSVAAQQDFWNDHWGGHSVDEMLDVARASPLTTLILEALATAPGRRVLEAGCGLGQYVILLRELGFPAIGVDWSGEALAACRSRTAVPLGRMDLRSLALRDTAFDACLSLGVVEHDVAGPEELLREAARVLVPGGVLVASVPYVNGIRALTSPWIRARNRAVARRGGGFYQYAFTRAELVRALQRTGFAVRWTRPYDPARLLRRFLPRRGRTTGPGPGGRHATSPARRDDSGLRRAAKRVLYSRPGLALLGHMLLAVAVKR
jgi:SAM-dependent methyltransferase